MANINQKHNYIVHGLSRSGNHAIIFWLIHNIVESVEMIDSSVFIDPNRILCYINNLNIYEGTMKIKFPRDMFPVQIVSYEDVEFMQDTSLIILRDFGNLLASRYKKHQPSIGLNNNYICDLLRLIEVWKQHTRSPKRTILYNKWLVSKEYRDMVSTNVLGVPNTNDKTDYVSSLGSGSSFSNRHIRQNEIDYLTRYQQVLLPEYIKRHIIKDDELIQLNKKIFGIDLQNTLC